MPTDTTPGAPGPRPAKPTTRNSIRQSLNLSSMGKALADVMNKSESRVPSEKSKKPKEAPSASSSRRTSAVGLPRSSTMAASGRTSIGGATSPVTRRDSTSTIGSGTVTRTTRRTSAVQKPSTTSVDELGVTAGEPTTPPKGSRISRSSSLRPKPTQTTALPKYRPKSIVAEAGKKPATPPRAGTRRRLESSDDEKEDRITTQSGKSVSLQSPAEKDSRPISPLPQRASALKVNLTSAINITPSTPERKSKIAAHKTTSSPTKLSDRVAKTAKLSPPTSTKQPAPPRSSSSSSSSSRTTPPTTPRTPKVQSSLRSALSFRRNNDSKSNNKGGSPLRVPAHSSPTPSSPLSRHSRKNSATRTPTTKVSCGSSSTLQADSSEDSLDVDDVEMLLAPTASLAAPTPAIPRLQSSRSRRQDNPTTPTRSTNQLPHRSHLSYTSPLPPTAEESPYLRPKPQPGNERGSLMSWDQLAKESSRTMTEEEAESMITGLDLPFKSNSVSPEESPLSPMQLDIPESPCLSALPSPGGYASISHVLLPDITPSPAPQNENRYGNGPEIPAVDAAIVTLLRLQLASAENTAKERLYQLQSLEEQLHNSKELRLREADELANQVSFLEQQLHSSVNVREKFSEEQAAYTASLEDQVRHAEAYRDQAIEAAVAKMDEQRQASQKDAIRVEQQKWELATVASDAISGWNTVRTLATDELESVRADKQLLAVLLSGLDQSQRHAIQANI